MTDSDEIITATESAPTEEGFLGKYLPVSERKDALWLALGGAAVMYLADQVRSVVLQQVPVGLGAGSVTLPVGQLIAAMAAFAVVTLVVAALIRFARAPKSLALLLVLASLVAIPAAVLRLPLSFVPPRGIPPGVPVPSGGQEVLRALAILAADNLPVLLGALSGAWVAQTVSLARIRDVGFSGDEADGRGLSTHPERIGLSFIGWRKPLEGDSLLAVAYAGVQVIPAVVSVALVYVTAFIPMGSGSVALSAAYLVSWGLISGIAWGFSANLIVRRVRVRSLWFAALGGSLPAMASVIEFVFVSIKQDSSAILLNSTNLPLLLIPAVAAWIGTWLALRREPATLSPDGMQDPVAPEAPLDTAGDER